MSTSRDARVWSTMGGGRADDDDETEPTTLGNNAITFNSTLFGRKMLFGGVTGVVCGAGFGVLVEALPKLKQNIPNKPKVFFKTVGSACGFYGGYFAAYQAGKYLLEVARNEDDWVNTLFGGALGIIPVIKTANVRARAPYAAVLVAMDCFHDDSTLED